MSDLTSSNRTAGHRSASNLPLWLKEKGFVAGHISLSTLLAGRPESQLVTILREPISRILSHWLFCRAATDAQLEPWGSEWSIIVQQSRGSLMDFLTAPMGASQSDNLMLRYLLRPHTMIPEAGFIDERHDDALLAEAVDRLRSFSLVDVSENPVLEINLGRWFGGPMDLPHLNQASEIPPTLRRDILVDLTDATFALLRHRARLDLALWTIVFQRFAPDAAIQQIQQRALTRDIVRLSRLLRGN